MFYTATMLFSLVFIWYRYHTFTSFNINSLPTKSRTKIKDLEEENNLFSSSDIYIFLTLILLEMYFDNMNPIVTLKIHITVLLKNDFNISYFAVFEYKAF